MTFRAFRPFWVQLLVGLLLPASAFAYDIANGVEFLDNPISKPDNSPIVAGQFTLRLGYFNFSPDRNANNAAIVANQGNLATLNANFVELFNFNPAQQTEGDPGAYSTAAVRNPNGEAGPNASLPNGTAYAYLLTTDAVWNAAPYNGFIGKQIYAWVQLVSEPSQQAIFTSTTAFTFNPGNDPFDNATQFVISEFNPNVNVVVGTNRTATASNDYQLVAGVQPGAIRLSAASYTTNEGDGSVAITVQRVNGSDGAISATLSTANGSAQAGQDYTAVDQTVTFADGSAADQVINIPVLNDSTFEGDETFQVALSAPMGGATLATPSSATVTIQEDDPPPAAGAVRFSSATFSGPEDGGSITITATRSSGAGGAITVQYSTSNGSAIAGTDYTATSGTLSWSDQEGGNKSFIVPVSDNTADQPNKNFTVTLSNPTGGAAIVTPSTATVTIVDDDVAGSISFASATASVAENGGVISITVQRTGGSDGAVSATFTTSNSSPVSAQAGQDYTAVTRTVTFPNGSAASQIVTVPILDDTIFEGAETFRATLTNPAGGASIGMPSAITVTITDNEISRPGSLSFSSANYTGAENGGPVTITATRSNGADGEVNVNYNATAGTATAGADFTSSSGMLTFAAGQTSATFQVTLIDDLEIEPNETVNLALSVPTNGATLGTRPTAVLTIISDDQLPPVDQPDGLIAPRGSTSLVGNNVYNTTGNGQIASRNGRGNSVLAFVARIQNDGTATDTIRVNGVASGTAANASVRYFHNGIDVTPQISQLNGFVLPALAPQGSTDIDVQVRFEGSARFTGYGTTLTITSQRSPGKSDVVRAVGIVNEDGQAPEPPVQADLNTDRQSDLLWQNNSSGARTIWLMNGADRVGEGSLPKVSTDWEIASSGDFNSDKKTDIVWQNRRNGDRAVWFMNGLTRAGDRYLPRVSPDWQIAGSGDFDGDEKADILWQNNRTGQRVIWLMNGTTRVGDKSLPTVSTNWEIAGAGDFGGDGHVDILWQHKVTGQRAIWLMNGTTMVGSKLLPTVSTDWQIAGTGDYNADRQLDIVWQHKRTGQRAVWLMNGTNRVGDRTLPTIPTEWQIRNQ